MAGGGNVSHVLGVIMVYNVLAFLTQPLTGMLADRIRNRQALVAAATALLAVGVATASLSTLNSSLFNSSILYSTAILLGMGNSLFHVWGGKEVALSTHNSVCALGCFVSTGALGLAVGMLLHSWWLMYLLLILLAVLAAVAFRLPANGPVTVQPRRFSDKIFGHTFGSIKAKDLRQKAWLAWLVVLLMMAFVVFRSFLGEAVTADVGKGGVMALMIGGLAMVGKAGGGWMARGMGLATVFSLALAGAVACTLLKGSVGWLWLPGLLLINCTMAVTLCWANSVMPGREGLVFGLLAAALMPGYLIAQTAGGSWTAVMPGLLASLLPTIVIELMVLVGLRENRSDVLWSSVVVNILTNVPLNLYLTNVSYTLTAVIVGELVVVAVEAWWYYYFVNNMRRAAVYSILCNGISVLTGVLVMLMEML